MCKVVLIAEKLIQNRTSYVILMFKCKFWWFVYMFIFKHILNISFLKRLDQHYIILFENTYVQVIELK